MSKKFKDYTSFEGERGVRQLNEIAESLGYKEEPAIKYGSSLEKFLSDNSGACEELVEWIAARFPIFKEKGTALIEFGPERYYEVPNEILRRIVGEKMCQEDAETLLESYATEIQVNYEINTDLCLCGGPDLTAEFVWSLFLRDIKEWLEKQEQRNG